MTQPRKRSSPAAPSDDRLRSLWLAPDFVLLSGLPAGDWDSVQATAKDEVAVETRGVAYSRPGRDATGIVLLRFLEHGRGSLPDSLSLKAGSTKASITGTALAAAEISLEQFVNEEIAGGDLDSRSKLQAHLAALGLPGLERPGAIALASRLRALRDTLRDPLAQLGNYSEAPQAGSIELIMAVDERSFWIVGWVWDVDRTMRELVVVTPEGQRADLLTGAYRHVRRDVQESFGDRPAGEDARHGFVTYLELPHPSLLEAGWLVELHRTDGSAQELSAPPVVRDAAAIRVRILDEFSTERTSREQLRTEHAHPALVRFQESRRELVEVEEVRQYGTPPPDAHVSIVVPLYERIDFLAHQLTHFGWDAEIGRSDLIYVLDTPRLANEVNALAPELHALNRIPFRIVTLARNAGYPAANNVGVQHANGRLVLLLNSDVVPAGPGWLGRMVAFYDSTPDIGALGPKLLYEDLSIQHAGMYFRREVGSGLWGNMHYFKGLHRDFPAACATRTVPAVTGACLMVARDLYLELEGLRDLYVLGGYEDSDFCIRLIERGRHNWYLSEVELYHLEAQSFESPVRPLATAYNTWLQTHFWDDAIARIMHDQEARELVSEGQSAVPGRLSSVA